MEVHGYTETGAIDATIDGQRGIVPDDPTNRHRQMIAEWEAEGNTIPAYAPPPEPSPLNQTLTKRQVVRAMIIGSGIDDPDAHIETAIDAMADPTQRSLARADWRYAPYYMRDHPLFSDTELLSSAGMTPQQVDALWALGVDQPQ